MAVRDYSTAIYEIIVASLLINSNFCGRCCSCARPTLVRANCQGNQMILERAYIAHGLISINQISFEGKSQRISSSFVFHFHNFVDLLNFGQFITPHVEKESYFLTFSPITVLLWVCHVTLTCTGHLYGLEDEHVLGGVKEVHRFSNWASIVLILIISSDNLSRVGGFDKDWSAFSTLTPQGLSGFIMTYTLIKEPSLIFKRKRGRPWKCSTSLVNDFR